MHLLIAMMLTLSRVINDIFTKVDEHINNDSLMTELNMGALPDLYELFVNLIAYLVS